ncbi:MAG: ATP-binding protein [Candidatus Sumerlaeaceae bacterium]
MSDPQGNFNTLEQPQIELRCRLDGSMLGLLREFVCTVARHLCFPEPQVAEIEICVDEACANVVEHAYSNKRPAGPKMNDLLVEIRYSGEQMVVRIVDHGDGNVPKYPSPLKSVEDYADNTRERFRGLGFLLMEKFMDRVDVHCAPGGGTTVELMKIRQK